MVLTTSPKRFRLMGPIVRLRIGQTLSAAATALVLAAGAVVVAVNGALLKVPTRVPFAVLTNAMPLARSCPALVDFMEVSFTPVRVPTPLLPKLRDFRNEAALSCCRWCPACNG